MINVFQNHRENMYYAINDAGTTNFFGGESCIFTLYIMAKLTKNIDWIFQNIK